MTKQNRWIFTILTGCLLGSSFLTPVRPLLAAPAVKAEVDAVKVNVNKADAKELETVRGIGPMLAERIIQFRQANGPFKGIDDLVQVQGIGQAKLEKIKSQLTL